MKRTNQAKVETTLPLRAEDQGLPDIFVKSVIKEIGFPTDYLQLEMERDFTKPGEGWLLLRLAGGALADERATYGPKGPNKSENVFVVRSPTILRELGLSLLAIHDQAVARGLYVGADWPNEDWMPILLPKKAGAA